MRMGNSNVRAAPALDTFASTGKLSLTCRLWTTPATGFSTTRRMRISVSGGRAMAMTSEWRRSRSTIPSFRVSWRKALWRLYGSAPKSVWLLYGPTDKSDGVRVGAGAGETIEVLPARLQLNGLSG